MTSEVAVVTLEYDGHDIQDEDGIFLDLFRGGPGELAQVRGRDDIVPGLDGRVARNRRLDRRLVELRGFVRGTGSDESDQRADYWNNRQTLADWFDPIARAVLAATFPGLGGYSLTCLPLSIVYNEIVPSMALVSIELESIDPEWAAGS